MVDEEIDPNRLKKAEKLYEKYYLKKYKKGKITKEELKNVLAPYKEELVHLGLLPSSKKEVKKPSIPKKEAAQAPKVVGGEVKDAIILSIPEVGAEDQLPVNEIEKRVDALGEEKVGRIREMYRSRYGEELDLPQELERRRRKLWALKEKIGEEEKVEKTHEEKVVEKPSIKVQKGFWSIGNILMLTNRRNPSGVVKLIYITVDVIVWILLLLPRIILFPFLLILNRRRVQGE